MHNSLSKNHPFQMFLSLWKHRSLASQLIKRDILAKYRGSVVGMLWLVLFPLLMLSLYTIVFVFFMKVTWPGVTNNFIFSLMIYVGLIILNFFSECLTRSTTIIINNPNFVKKVVFPLEIYPWIIVGSALFQVAANILILMLFCFFLLGKIYYTIFFLPLLLLPLILVVLGISWFLCSAGVYIRDMTHLMVFIMQVIIYLSPVFYSLSVVPVVFQKILLMNPLTFIIEQARVVVYGGFPNWSGLGIYFMISLCVAYSGFIWFQHTKKGFADVL